MPSKAILAAAIFIAVSGAVSTGAHAKTLTLKPGPSGKDAVVFGREDQKDKNFANSPRFHAETWTWNADNLGTGSYRSLIAFDLQGLPEGADIQSASLKLFADTATHTKGHSTLSSSNASRLYRVKAQWAESTVTWNSQPGVDTAGARPLAASTGTSQDYAVDVTAMVRDMHAHPAANHGFLLRANAETPYHALSFASGDHGDSAKRPALVIEYEDLSDVDVVTLKPGAAGKDAALFGREDQKGKNFGNGPRLNAETWTWNADNLGTGSYRSLIAFDLATVTAKTALKAAYLHLKCDTTNHTKGHSNLSQSNAAWLYRVKGAWAESTVTWANQPETDSAGRVAVPRSDSVRQDYKVDVTALVEYMLAHPDSNHGFLLRSGVESPYNSLSFASGDHADSTRHPVLELRFQKASTGAEDRVLVRVLPLARAYRLAGHDLVLSRAMSGRVADLQGRTLLRFSGSRIIDLRGLQTGAYLLSAEGISGRFFLP